MIRAIAACGNGMGSSQMIKMKITKVFKKLGVVVDVQHNSVGAAKADAVNYDVVFVSQNFTKEFANAEKKGTIVIGLKNLLSEAEIEEKIMASGLLDKKK